MAITEWLLLGDARKRLGEIGTASVDLIVTDPPYNTGMTARISAYLRNFFDDRFLPEEYRTLAETTARECHRILKQDRGCYVFVSWRSLGVWVDALAAAGFRLKNVIVWDKVIHGLNYQNYAHTHEFLIFAAKGRFWPRNKGTGDDQRCDLWRVRRDMGRCRATEFHHETVKPESLIRRPIEHGSLPGELVCDPFMGAGTTGAVAKMLGRGFISIEKNEEYFALAAERIARVRPNVSTIACDASEQRRRAARKRWKKGRSPRTRRAAR